MNKIKKAYIIDDDEIIVYLTDKIIKEENFCEQSETFNNGQLALDRLKEVIENGEPLPDVMLVDINMPVMDGWELLDEIVKLPLKQPIPLIIFTSSINPADREKAFTYSTIKGYIQKPLTVLKLDKILRLIY
ncbi:MAG: response regulator [bacterium]|nr:response regulator [bacterium]